MSLAVVGADFPNPGKAPSRRFEIALCQPGDPIDLVPEPKNPADKNAIAVISERGVQLGYLTAERAPFIRKLLAQGEEVQAIFQRKAAYGAVIRLAFGGQMPELADVSGGDAGTETRVTSSDDTGFWPDYIPPDD